MQQRKTEAKKETHNVNTYCCAHTISHLPAEMSSKSRPIVVSPSPKPSALLLYELWVFSHWM